MDISPIDFDLLDQYSYDQLRRYASYYNINERSSMNKSELIDALYQLKNDEHEENRYEGEDYYDINPAYIIHKERIINLVNSIQKEKCDNYYQCLDILKKFYINYRFVRVPNPNIRRVWHPHPFIKESRQDFYYRTLGSEIENNELIWTYYGLFYVGLNETKPHKVTPENFEAHSFFSDIDTFIDIKNYIIYTTKYDKLWKCAIYSNGGASRGLDVVPGTWNRDQVLRAIIDTGLTYGKDSDIMIDLKDIGMKKSDIEHFNESGYVSRWSGVMFLPYQDLYKLESIYRQYLKYYYWGNICKNKQYDDTTLEYLKTQAMRQYRYSQHDLSNKKHQQICNMLVDEKERREQISRELTVGVREIALPLIYQPGSVWLEKPLMFGEKDTALYIPPEYHEYYNICSNSKVSKSEIIDLALELGFVESEIRGKTRYSICKMIQNYIENIVLDL